MAADIVWFALPLLVVLAVLLGGDLLAERRCRRENARIQADYRAACLVAKRDGQPPPFPPNELRCR